MKYNKFSPQEIATVLSTADNMNAALKTFLKREARSDNSVEPFVKSLRSVVARNRDGELLAYIEKLYPAYEAYFSPLFSYAFPKVRDAIATAVVEQYGDTFNATYERREKGIQVTKSAEFSSIAREVLVKVEQGLDQAGVPRNNFSVSAMLAAIFEPDVLVKVLEIL